MIYLNRTVTTCDVQYGEIEKEILELSQYGSMTGIMSLKRTVFLCWATIAVILLTASIGDSCLQSWSSGKRFSSIFLETAKQNIFVGKG